MTERPVMPYHEAATVLHAKACRSTRIDVSAYRIPTDAPEADGTFAWQSTTLVVVEASGGRA